MRSFQKFYNLMKEMQILLLPEGDMDIWKNQKTANIDEAESRNEIISEDKNEEINDEEEKYVFTKDLYLKINIPPAWTNTDNHIILL